MSPRSSEEFERLRNEKIELIERAALRCFAEHGFHSTSINRIAKEAKISTGLMYNYFKSKEDLLKSIFVQGLDKIFKPFKDSDGPISHEQFIEFIEHNFSELEHNIDYWKTYFTVAIQPSIISDFQEFMLEKMIPSLNVLVEYFASQKYEDPMLECRFLGASLDGIGLNYIMDSENFPLQGAKKKLLKLYEK